MPQRPQPTPRQIALAIIEALPEDAADTAILAALQLDRSITQGLLDHGRGATVSAHDVRQRFHG